jgi:excisionase family DNA binding protein
VDRIVAAMLSMPPELTAELRTIIWDWLGSAPEPLAGAGRGQSSSGEGGYTDVGMETLGLLTVKQAANLLKVSDRTVRRLVYSGKLKQVRIGTALRIAPEDLTAFIDTLRNSPPS